LRLDGPSYSPALLERILTRAGRLKSFEQAAIALGVAADVDISGRQINRLTHEVGADLARRRDEQAARSRRRELPARVAEPPPVAVVEVDGGRLGTRQPGVGPGVYASQPKEDKSACLISMASDRHAEDPQPQPPASFRDAPRVARLVRQLQGQAAAPADEPVEDAAAAVPEPAGEGVRPGKPEPLLRTCVASLADSRGFGPLVAAEAQVRNFFAAERPAYVADGQHYNWRIQETWFPHAVPIVDFLHVLCYLDTAAWATEAEDGARWARFEAWMTACWQGRVGGVQAELMALQERLGRPPPGEELAATDPRALVAEALSYLGNNQSRMDDPRYRREGLPVTSSLVESLVGEFNGRVKGRDKYWNRGPGTEAMLQVRAAVLSQDNRLARSFAERPGRLYRRHPQPMSN
jgi:hypothetical protein